MTTNRVHLLLVSGLLCLFMTAAAPVPAPPPTLHPWVSLTEYSNLAPQIDFRTDAIITIDQDWFVNAAGERMWHAVVHTPTNCYRVKETREMVRRLIREAK